MRSQAKYTKRGAPRYLVTEGEAKEIRFSSTKNRKIVLTKIVDISETGISFITSHKLCPKVGDLINMEFAPPGSLQIAVQGRVVRTEEPTKFSDWAQFPGTVKIGVAFHNIPKQYKKLLSRALGELLMTSKDHFQVVSASQTTDAEPSWVLENAWSILASVFIFSIFVSVFFYFLNYYEPSKSSQSAPWAQNFFDKNIKKAK